MEDEEEEAVGVVGRVRSKREKRGKRRNIWLGLDIYREDSWVCWRLPVVFFFAVVALLPCGANGDSMCVMSEDSLSQHPKVASKTQPPPLAEIVEYTLTVQMD